MKILLIKLTLIASLIHSGLLFANERQQTPAELKLQIQQLEQELDTRKTPENLERSHYSEYRLKKDNQMQKQYDDTRWKSEYRTIEHEPVPRE